MMIKVSNEFLDFDDLIEMEKQIKLFEDISTTDGDFSYAFELQKTLHNTKLLGNPFPDNISKPVYQKIPAKLLSESGAETYDGYLRVERVTEVYECSFFAGNNNWFSQITGLLSDLDLSRYNIEQTRANVVSSWSNTDGIVFPLVDNGGLLTRSFPQVKIEDLVGGFYIKTIFNKVFAEAGIKIQGELINDWMYNNTICLKNAKSQSDIDLRSAYIQKTTLQVFNNNIEDIITWDNDSVYPFYNNGSFSLGTNSYTADLKMILKIETFFKYTAAGGLGAVRISVNVNGTEVAFYQSPPAVTATISPTFIITVEAGDVVTWSQTSPFAINLVEATLKITPNFIYKTFSSAAVPNWTKQQFVSNILRQFNVLASYKEGSHTLTLNLFEKLKSKPAIDLSEYISETEVDYSEFISDYGQNSILKYNEVEFDQLKEYNVGKFFKYGEGVIAVNNDFLEPDVEILESDFSNPIAYLNPVFDMSMELTNLIDFDEGDKVDVTSVTNSSGIARFNITEDLFLVGDLMRVEESTNPNYNGEWVVGAIGTGWIEFTGVPFDTDATATATKLNYVYANSDDVFLFVNIPSYEVEKFSGVDFIFLEANSEATWAVAYFDLMYTDKQINFDFIYSLSFGGIDDPLHYQTTMIEQYFRLFGQILNDPVKLFSTAHLPYDVYDRIDFLSPIKIRTLETQNLYYLNRITGYKESYLPTTLELIKI